MILQQTRFDIGYQVHPGISKMLRHRRRVGHFALIPGKDIALRPDRTVPRGQLKTIAGDLVSGNFINKTLQLHLRIRRIGITHGGP